MAKPLLRRALRIGALAGVALLAWSLAVWPPPSWYRAHAPRETAFMARATGEDTVERRYEPVTLEDVSPALLQAVLVAEDRRFFEHGGLDYQAIREAIGYTRHDFSWKSGEDRRAFWDAVSTLWARRREVRGASTITQQLAKNLYLSPTRNPLRKLKEAVTAYRLEAALGKHRILELYLSVVELGPGLWGVGSASKSYFHKPPARIGPSEAAWLAATLPNPRTANPRHQADRIRWRRDLILRRAQAFPVAIPEVP